MQGARRSPQADPASKRVKIWTAITFAPRATPKRLPELPAAREATCVPCQQEARLASHGGAAPSSPLGLSAPASVEGHSDSPPRPALEKHAAETTLPVSIGWAAIRLPCLSRPRPDP